MPSKKDIILSGLGWGRLPLHMINDEINPKRLVHLPELDDDDEATIYLCKKKSKPTGKVAKFIWDCF